MEEDDCIQPVIVIHGGAGVIPEERVQLKLKGMRKSIRAGYRVLMDGPKDDGSGVTLAMRSAVAAVVVMEGDGAFNTGYGSMLNEDGEVEMDAGVVEGNGLRYGGVGAIMNVKNPIEVAVKVMTSSDHCLLAGEGATQFAHQMGFEKTDSAALTSDYASRALEAAKAESLRGVNEGASGTVGAVVLDRWGNLAAATSTGGLANKRRGRVGDSPVNGAGVYADKQVAVSLTGFGECFMRTLASARVAEGVTGRGLHPGESVDEAMEYSTATVGGDGGGIAVDWQGRVGVGFNSFRMGWAYAKGGMVKMGCERGQVVEEEV